MAADARVFSLACELGASVNSARVAEVLVEAGRVAASACGAACIFRDGDKLTVASAHGMPGAIGVVGASLDIGDEHPVARAVRGGGAHVFLDANAATATLLAPVSACAILPLHSEGEVLGALVLTMPALGDDDRATLLAIGEEASRATHRVWLRERERRGLARFEHLARSTAAMAEALDFATTVERVLDGFVPELAAGCVLELGNESFSRGRVTGDDLTEVPVEARGKYVGLLRLFGSCASLEDLIIVEELARRAALALDAARLLREREEAIRLRDEFLDVAGHELRTPLTTLRMWIYAVERFGEALPVDARAASRQLTRLEHLIERMLDVSRMRDEELVLSAEPMDLGQLVGDLAAGYAGVQVDVAEEICGTWDRFRLGQVLDCLLANAVQYGRGQPIEIKVDREGGAARIAVRDRGIGIAACEQARIFERFERAAPSQHYRGLGLGLWVAHRIVCAHNGEIAVRSSPGEGSEFVVRLPYEAEARVA